MDIPTKNRRKFIPIVVVASTAIVGLYIYLGYKEPKVEFDSNAFKLKGIYGVNIPFAEIARVDTIRWREMPAISIRTNGISLFKVHRGNFRTTDGEKIRLSIYRGTKPVIRIVDHQGKAYYINRKDAAETRQIFNQLTINN